MEKSTSPTAILFHQTLSNVLRVLVFVTFRKKMAFFIAGNPGYQEKNDRIVNSAKRFFQIHSCK